ncbi:hypothetical protein DPMN_025836 [Dreissena polymorpha]|uniref:Uncharacterized protein n=1 Tax=Dreissena polymorpha TaxID=45954 RepID=A0A9D4RC07_DREPO|nr:hypothetical protein DPMN_025836 [Dreissena polymorpha]
MLQLASTVASVFQFQILASDERRVNPKVRAASVIIDVDTDSRPYFTNGTLIPALQETATANTIVHTLVAQDDDLTTNVSNICINVVGCS